MKFISAEFHARLKKSALTPGDVVIVRTGKPGACTVIPEWLPVSNCSDVVIVRCGNRLDPHFLAYYINAVAHDHVSAHLVGAVQQHFNLGAARKIKIPLPTLAEQSAMVGVLRALDKRIDILRAESSTLGNLCRSSASPT
jgi:type I restriction enzyme S subunit